MIFITSFLLGFSAFSDFGFYSQIDELDSLAVKSKIFQIYTPAGQYSSLPLSNKSVLLKGIENLMAQGEMDSIQVQAVLFQVSYCESKKIDPCLLFLDIIKGTAFTAGSQGTVWTAFHNVTGAAINAVGKQVAKEKTKDFDSIVEFMKQGRFPVYLVDEQGEIVVEPLMDESNWAKNIAFPYENYAEYFDEGTPTADRDFVKFNLPGLDVEPLPISENFKTNQSVFLGGYPDSTGVKKARFGGFDSDGQGFYYGKGSILDYEGFLKRQRIKGAVNESKKLEKSRQVITTADGYAGHSGSPFLNENGEVIGVFVEYLPIWIPTPSNNTSYGPGFSYIFEVLKSFDQ